MISTLLKKKINEEVAANMFVNAILDVVDNGFDEVKGFIEVDPAFEKQPDFNGISSNHFLLVVIVGNMENLDRYFSPEQCIRIEEMIYEQFAKVFQITTADFKQMLQKEKSYIGQINYPSKNMLYGMSKAVFNKYELNQYQQEYFRNMRSPNPLFLKRLDEIMSQFLWNWEGFLKKYRLAS